MLKKLLKYDFNAIFKYWWIGALTAFILSFVGAGCGSILETEKELPGGVIVFATIGMVLVVLGLFAFVIASELLIYIRFYKHLFTDEGYLTFTLPVKRHQILSSKIITGFVCTLLTGITTAINACIIIFTTFKKEFFYDGWYEDLIKSINETLIRYGSVNIIIAILEVIIIGVLLITLSLLFTYLCITVAGTISKKNKLGTAIIIYYLASSCASVFMYLFYFYGIDAIDGWTFNMSEDNQVAITLVILLLIFSFIAMLCTLAYTFITWLIDRKLNLN